MTSIAQRRVAGATALMILLYLIQVALFASPAQAEVNSVPDVGFPDGGPGNVCPEGGDWSSHSTDDSGEWGSVDGTVDGDVDVVVNDGFEVTVCVKKGNDNSPNIDEARQFYVVTYSTEGAVQTVAHTNGGLSHWSFKVDTVTTTIPDDPEPGNTDVTIEIEKCSPGDVPIDVYFDIPDEGYNVKVYNSEGATLKVITEDLTWLAPAGTYSWEMFANGDSGTVIDSGEFEVPVCVVTIVVETCSEDGALVGVEIDIPEGYNVKVYDSEGATVKAVTEDLTFFVGPGSYTWELFANGDLTKTVYGSGEFEVEECTTPTTPTTEGTTPTTQGTTPTTEGTTPTTQGTTPTTEGTTPTTQGTTIPFDDVPSTEEAEVLGTTITAAPQEVSADTLPFTGFESGDTVKLGLLALLAGALMLFAVRGTREEDTQAAADLGGWSTF